MKNTLHYSKDTPSKFLIAFGICFFVALLGNLPALQAQVGLNFEANLTYPDEMSDIWGFEKGGKEYVIATTTRAVSIVDISDPANPVEVFYDEPGNNTFWRDAKYWNNHVYIINEASLGLQIIDVSDLPNGTIDASDVIYWTGGTFEGDNINFTTSHNIFIDENGIAYIVGANYGVGGAIMVDLNTNATNPSIVGVYNQRYVHDCFVRNDTLWTAEINNGIFSVIDVSNKANPVVMATQSTTSNFTHNIWLSDDGNYVFTTDEVGSANIDAYDVSDLGDIELVDAVKSNPGSGVIPHNAFVVDNFVVVSYYRDGVVVFDATYPEQMIEVANYDTAPSFVGSGFNGCWGVYPYFNSGIIAATDIEEGLFILSPDFQAAAYLQGLIIDAVSGTPIFDASIEIIGGTEAVASTSFVGEYLTGTLSGGSYTVVVSATGYLSQTAIVSLVNGSTITLDVELEASVPFTLTGNITELGNGSNITDANIVISDGDNTYTATTNANGDYSIALPGANNYSIYVGKWGWVTGGTANVLLTSSNNVYDIDLAVGYYDDFLFDFGWTQSATASTGIWTRAVPNATSFNGNFSNPNMDDSDDFGNLCYVTGNSNSNNAGADDIDDGIVALQSPIFDLSGYSNPEISFATWFLNGGGSSTPDDEMTITLSNGISSVTLANINENNTIESTWVNTSFVVSDFISPTTDMQLVITVGDEGNPHLAEGGFDHFVVSDLGTPPLLLQANAWLQGAYVGGNMTTILNNENLLPANQPFNIAPWNYNGSEIVSSFAPNITDWVLLELRSSNDINTIVAQRAALITNSGQIVDVNSSSAVGFTGITSGESYYIVLRHRNHLAVVSSSTISLPNASSFSFSNPANIEGGSEQLSNLGGANYALIAGDINSDGVITVADFNFYQSESSQLNNYFSSDCNLDKAVTVGDFNLFSNNSSTIGINVIRY